jgi:hypothetical protein
MRRMTLRAALFALLLLTAVPVAVGPLAAGPARAQSAVPPIGAEVKDPKGVAVGKVERIILGPDGRPRQALVRVDRVLRALPVEALQATASAYVAILSRAEIAALPPAE